MIFASVDLREPEPTCPYYLGTGDRTCKSGCWEEPRCITDEPLNGYGHTPQHDPPNRILAQIRSDDARSFATPTYVRLITRAHMWIVSIDALAAFGGFTAWDSPGHPRHILTLATPEEIDHARRVLTRLLSIAEVSS